MTAIDGKMIRYIREKVLHATQSDFAEIAGTTQPTVNRWEAGRLYPDIRHLERIRAYARKRGIPWSDAWFFRGESSRNDRID